MARTSRIWNIEDVKPARFHSAARDALRAFPEDVRRELGKAIYDLQLGYRLAMPLSRPMPDIARGAAELRVRDPSGVYRAFYVVRTAEAVLIFHAFAKKSEKTPMREIVLGQKRLEEMSR